MLDPQLQGISWIKEREAKRGLVSVRMGAPNMLLEMEKAMGQVRRPGGAFGLGVAGKLLCHSGRLVPCAFTRLPPHPLLPAGLHGADREHGRDH